MGPLTTTISRTSPRDGEQGVAVTRETVFRFSAGVREESVTQDAIFAEFGGELLAGRLRRPHQGLRDGDLGAVRVDSK